MRSLLSSACVCAVVGDRVAINAQYLLQNLLHELVNSEEHETRGAQQITALILKADAVAIIVRVAFQQFKQQLAESLITLFLNTRYTMLAFVNAETYWGGRDLLFARLRPCSFLRLDGQLLGDQQALIQELQRQKRQSAETQAVLEITKINKAATRT